MKQIMKWSLSLICIVALALAVPMLPAWAQDEEDGGEEATLDPALQWRLAESAWGRREYDDAAALMSAYAELNPDEPNALEALWRVYEVYRAYRPNPERKKITYEKAVAASVRWTKKYAESNKERAAQAMWYNVMLLEHEGARPQSILMVQDLLKRFPGTTYDDDAYWSLGEWFREAKRYQEAIPNYVLYRKVAGNTELAALACFREGNSYEELKNKQAAIDAYKLVLNGEYNWGWGQVHWGTLEVARRLKTMGEEELSRAFALKLIDKTPKEWDVNIQARTFIGQKIINPKKIWIHPHLYYNYTSDKVNIDGRTKMMLSRDISTLVRLQYVSKEDPFKATLTLTPKLTMDKTPDNMKKSDGAGGRTIYTADIIAPDAAGNVTADSWYKFTEAAHAETSPDNLVITRKWEKAGETWGNCTIRVQSSARWHMWIYLPNDKTNANNLSMQPNEVNDAGKTFRWYDWYDMNQGITIKFPVEVGGNMAEYYPKIRLERHAGGLYADKTALGTDADYDLSELSVKLNSADAFPYTVNFPGYKTVTIDEVSK